MALVNRRVVALVAIFLAALCALFLNVERLDDIYFSISTGNFNGSTSDQRPLNPWFPVLETVEDASLSWLAHNSRSLRALMQCTTQRSCRPRQADVVITASTHFLRALRGGVSGEQVWANSIIAALDDLGYTVLYADSNRHASTLHSLVPDLVRAVIFEETEVDKCVTSNLCVKSPQHPLGIPVWKMFTLTFFAGTISPIPLDARWVLAPEEYSTGHLYIGYSVERTCTSLPVVPTEQRDPVAFVYGKHKGYWQEKNFAWSGVNWARPPPGLEDELGLKLPPGFKFLACADKTYTDDPELPLPEGITNLCSTRPLPQAAFTEQLSKVRLLVGVGRPWVSPTPYDALCQGIPFLNPIHTRDRAHPENRTKWTAQHDGLKAEDAPLIYNVYRDADEKVRERAFWTAVIRGVNTPIERHILERMTMSAVRERVEAWLQHDWRKDAEDLMNERRAKGGKLFTL
ncbi:hypothetical protein EXIGLDRAFT_840337 [Exidia glandulosa HHB12029]|uniref:Uncharacterized protein n=1 Tax=Exidia glandulosa HHB12029 TaxID=1314781 RepID=A0A165EHQ5_EXIGL|nr:hypothetical protein EXIGLDRAFT_840337 [Exidia glandulosa HHB12029]